MNPNRPQPRTFHLIGNKYSNYFDHDYFMGRDVFSDFWDSKNKKAMVVEPPKKKFIINVTLPAFREDEIGVHRFGNKIEVSASIKGNEVELIRDDYFAQEMHLENYYRTFDLPDGLDLENIHHEFDGKVLTISIPYSLA